MDIFRAIICLPPLASPVSWGLRDIFFLLLPELTVVACCLPRSPTVLAITMANPWGKVFLLTYPPAPKYLSLSPGDDFQLCEPEPHPSEHENFSLAIPSLALQWRDNGWDVAPLRGTPSKACMLGITGAQMGPSCLG